MPKARPARTAPRAGATGGARIDAMNVESLRAYLLTLPYVEETMQWGDNLVFWVGDKAIGGKMFALANLSPDSHGVLSFSAGPERYPELLEIDGVFPAPYMARIFWVAIERYDAFLSGELKDLLRNAHALTYNKLPKRTKDALALPAAERKKLIMARRKLLASGEKKK
jgi:predicted DNA-binding protein (MmcQ/YjbR family)